VPDDERTLRLLASIDRRLALLSAGQERDMRQALHTELRSDARVKMFELIDGTRTSQELARAANVTERAAQLFVKELMETGLARDTGRGSGRAVIVERDEDAIVRWYIGRQPT